MTPLALGFILFAAFFLVAGALRAAFTLTWPAAFIFAAALEIVALGTTVVWALRDFTPD